MQQQHEGDEVQGHHRQSQSQEPEEKRSSRIILSAFAAKKQQHHGGRGGEDSSTSNGMTHEEERNMLAADIAEAISASLKTVGLIAALLSSWGSTVYAGEQHPNGGLCYGSSMVKASLCMFWISLGWFFLCVSSTLVIVADLDGIPHHLLLQHLQQTKVQIIYQVPELSIIGGVIFLAIAYAIDIGERAGCTYLYFGLCAAPGFVLTISIMFVILRNERQRLNDRLTIKGSGTSGTTTTTTKKNLNPLGTHWIASWRDRLATIDDETNALHSVKSSSRELEKMSQDFRNGMETKKYVSTHVYHFKKYKKTFVGRTAVTYMIEHNMVSSREDAVILGQRFMRELHLFHHVTWDHTFKDGYLFYRFTEDDDGTTGGVGIGGDSSDDDDGILFKEDTVSNIESSDDNKDILDVQKEDCDAVVETGIDSC